MPISGPKKNKKFTRSIDRGRIEEAVVESRISINAKKNSLTSTLELLTKEGRTQKQKKPKQRSK